MENKTDGVKAFHWLRAGMAALMALVVLAMFPYTGDPTGDIKWLLVSWGAYLLAAGLLAVSWRAGIAFRRPPALLEILLAFLAFNAIAALRSDYFGLSMVDMRRYWALFLLYLVSSQLYETPAQVRRLILAICGAVFVAAIYAFMQRAGLDFFPWADLTSEEYRNLPATYGNPNFAAHTLILAIILAVYLAAKKEWIWSCLFAAVFMVHLNATHQRAGLVALVGALTLVIVGRYMGRRVKETGKAAALSLAVTAAIGVFGLLAVMGLTKVATGDAFPRDMSLLIRYSSYCSAARMILQHPVLGYGPGVYKTEYSRFWTPYEQDWFARELKQNAHVHNDALEIGIDAGLPAAGLYLAFLILGMGYGLLMAYRNKDPQLRRMGYMFTAFFAAFFIDGLFGFNLRVPVSATLLFVMAGVMEGVHLAACPPKPAAPLNRFGKVWRTAVMAVALLCVLADSRLFASETMLQLGRRQVYRNDAEQAQKWFQRGERLTPWNWQFSRQLGLMRLSQRDLPGAAAHLDRSIELNPYYIVTLVAMARAQMGMGVAELAKMEEKDPKKAVDTAPALDKAAKYAEQALALCPNFAPAEEVLGRVASVRAVQLNKRLGGSPLHRDAIKETWRIAESHLTRAIDLGAEDRPELYRLQARVFLGLEDADKAEQALVCAAQSDPASEETWANFYEYATRMNRFDRMRSTLQSQIQRMTKDTAVRPESIAGAYLWLANVCSTGYKDANSAEEMYQEAARRAPQRPDVWGAYARFASQNGRLPSFVQTVRASQQTLIDANQLPLPEVKAVALVDELGDEALGEAARLLMGALDARIEAGHGPTAANEIGWAADYVRARTEAARPEIPGVGDAFLALGVFYGRLGEYGTAVTLYPKALPHLSAADQAVCTQHWAQALTSLNKPAEAIGLLRQALEKEPEHPELLWTLARVYTRAGIPVSAREAYEKLIALPGLDEEMRSQAKEELALVGAESSAVPGQPAIPVPGPPQKAQ